MNSRIPACLLLTLLGALLPSSVRAHVPRHLAGSQCRVLFFEDHVEISIDIGFRGSWAQAEMLAADSNRNSVVEKKEADAYLLENWEKRILRRGAEEESPAITCLADDAKLTVELRKSLHEGLVGQIAPTPFSLYYTVVAHLAGGPMRTGKTYRVEILDQIFEGTVPGAPLFLVPFSGHGLDPSKASIRYRFIEPGPENQMIDAQGDQLILEGRKLMADLSVHPPKAGATTSPLPLDAKVNPPGGRTASRAPATEPRSRKEIETAFLNSLLKQDGSASSWFAVCLLLVFLLGASHSLAPGHGKTMVAAYLAGSRCRYRHAFLLGLITTFTHTLVFFGIGAILPVVAGNLARGAIQERIFTTCMLLSGFLLTAMGLVSFRRRANRDSEASRDEARDHSSPCATPKRRLRDLFGLGISGGLLPCAPGIMIIAMGLHQPGKLLFSLLLLVAFSLGLGSVLVLIGIFTISGKKLLASLPALAPLRRNLPGFPRTVSLVSALLIIALGAFVVARTVLSRPAEIDEILAWMGF